MNRYLLDTCTFLWMIKDDPVLPDSVKEILIDPKNTIYLSAISTSEILLKNSLGKLPLPHPAHQFIRQQREKHHVETLSFQEEDAEILQRLPPLHRDPFDRFLMCQSIAQNLVLLTNDRDIQKYPIRTLW